MLAGLSFTSAALAALALSFAIAPGTALHIRNNASPVTLPFAKRINATGASRLLQIDRARAQSLKKSTRVGPISIRQDASDDVAATNQAVDYVATVGLSAILHVLAMLTHV